MRGRNTSTLTEMLGIRTPLQSHPLQALVSELLEPVHPTIVMSNAVHVYVSQAHKGELVMGAGVDSYNGYGQRGAFNIIERQMAAARRAFPPSSPARIFCARGRESSTCAPTPPPSWAAAGYEEPVSQRRMGHRRLQSHPWHRVVSPPTRSPTARKHGYIAPFNLDRFVTGALVDEHGAAGVAH